MWVNGARRLLGKSAMTCDSTLAPISRQTTQRNLTDFARSWARTIQYFVLVFATVAATPGCPNWWACWTMRRDMSEVTDKFFFFFMVRSYHNLVWRSMQVAWKKVSAESVLSSSKIFWSQMRKKIVCQQHFLEEREGVFYQ